MNWLWRKFLVNAVLKKTIGFITELLNKIPGNDRKTATGFVLAVLGLVLQVIPETSEYVQPILDALKSLPAEEIVGGGVLWMVLGIFHKGLKWIRSKLWPVPDAPVIIEVTAKPSQIKKVS